VFRRRLILRIIALHDLTDPPVATILLGVGAVLPPFGRLDVNTLVDVE
jgi:hypothetical protein